jgi:putative ABC transport system permease protein
MGMSIRRFFRRRGEDDELLREMEAHVAHEIDENIARGLPEAEARRRARLKLGSAVSVREEVWEWNTVEMLDSVWRDLKYAVRTLRRAPGFAIAVVLVMALGIGANTALFAIVRSVLLKPLPFGDPNRLVMLYEISGPNKLPNVVAGGIFEAWQKEARSFEQMAVFGGAGYTLSGNGGQLPEQIAATTCSWNLFSILGVQPALGREFDAGDDSLNANATVILTWGLWKRRFGGDPAILGKSIQLNAKAYTVIGVMPSWFVYPDADTQVWTPLYHETPANIVNEVDWHEFQVAALLKPGIPMAQGVKEVDTIEKRIHDEHPLQAAIGIGATGRWLFDDMVGDYKTPLYVLLAATGCVLLIACLNVANLLVARSAARRKELAIRSALGGSRWRLIREQVIESVALSVMGGIIGLELAYLAIQWVIHTRQDMARVDTIHMDSMVLLFAAGITMLGGVFAGVFSAFSSRNKGIPEALLESSRTHSGGKSKARLRRVLLTVEIGLTVVLLVSAGLLLKSYQTLRGTNLGCVTNNVLTMHVALPEGRYQTAVQRATFFERLIGDARRLPGVQKAGLVTLVPGDGYGGDSLLTIVEHPPLPEGQIEFAVRRGAEPGYFEAMGIPLLRGRTFLDGERLERATSVIVTDSFVRAYMPGEDPIGKHIRVALDGPDAPKEYAIVGVVGDSRYAIAKPVRPMMYFPLYRGTFDRATIVVRSQQETLSLALPIQKLVAQMDPSLAVFHILTMEQVIGRSTTDASFNAELTLAFAVLSLVLASVGLYGVLSYLVAQRRSEIGVRMALGAQRTEVVRLTLVDGLRPASLGLVLGLAGGAAAAKMIRDLLYGVEPLDAGVFAGVAVILLVVAIAACVLPAWRAARLDPVEALRME